MEFNYHHNYNHIIHISSSSSSSSPPYSSHPNSFPIIAVAIIGIFATIFLLVFYYIFVIKCCLNWHRIDILRRFSLSRNRNNPLVLHHRLPPSPHFNGLDESVIRSIPIFQFDQKHKDSAECAVCLVEFRHDEKLRIIPNCAHVFHIDCIDIWLQNNPNCPLCRNSISVSLQTHFPLPETQLVPSTTTLDEDYVVIEFDSGGREDDNRPNSSEPVAISDFPRKKMAKKLRKKDGYLSSMGDEWIDVDNRRRRRTGNDDQFGIQPIRRSFSMDSASDRQLYLAIQEVIQRNTVNNNNNDNVDVIEVSDGSGSRLGRGFFSFGHARSAILPLHHVKP